MCYKIFTSSFKKCTVSIAPLGFGRKANKLKWIRLQNKWLNGGLTLSGLIFTFFKMLIYIKLSKKGIWAKGSFVSFKKILLVFRKGKHYSRTSSLYYPPHLSRPNQKNKTRHQATHQPTSEWLLSARWRYLCSLGYLNYQPRLSTIHFIKYIKFHTDNQSIQELKKHLEKIFKT